MQNARWYLNSIPCKLYAITALKWVCYCTDNTTITHYSTEKQRTMAKELSMDSFKCQCKHTSTDKSVFTTLVCLYQEQTSMRTNVIGAYTHILLAWNARELQVGYLLANSTRSRRFPIHSIQMRVFLFPLWHFMMYNHNLVKAAVGANPSRISPNHTCQYSVLTLSYNISPSHFFIAHYF